MERINYHFELDDDLKELKHKQVEVLCANPFVKEWLKNYQVGNEVVSEYSSKFSAYSKVKEKCLNCEGLFECSQPNKGYFMNLVFEDDFLEVLTPCAYEIEFIKQTKYLENVAMNDMNPELMFVNLDTMKDTIKLEDVSTKKAYAELILSTKENKGLYLWGAPGVGKSYLVGATLNQLASHGRRAAFVHVPTLMSDLKMLFSDGEAMRRKLDILQNIAVLVLDDLGGEAVSAWSRDDILIPILDARLHKQKLTYFTSNYNINDLYEKYQLQGQKGADAMASKRINDRIIALSKNLQLKGKSRRI